jgi:multiple sugar transport system ATP-binding protein
MGDRIVVMKDGVVQQVDSPLTIYHHPVNRFVAGFIGSPTMNFFSGAVTKDGQWYFRQDGTGFRLPVPDAAAAQFSGLAGGKVTLGIRPEHIYAGRPAGITTLSPFTANIDVVEPVGNEIFVYFSTGGGAPFVARIASDTAPAVGQPYELLVDTSKLHFFDAATEQRL